MTKRTIFSLMELPRASSKKLPETHAIFAQVKQCNEEADADEGGYGSRWMESEPAKVGPFALSDGDTGGHFPARLR
jgi:hypothetical protein